MKDLFKILSGLGLESFELLRGRNGANTLGELCNTLLSLKGEASSIAIAREVLATWRNLGDADKLDFFRYLLNDLAASSDAVQTAVAAYQASGSQADLQVLARAVEPPRQDLLRLLNMAPRGTPALVDMRADLLRLLPANPELRVLDFDFLQLFKAWFNRGFLELRKIDWQTPAVVLEKLIEYESVHEIKGWDDLRRRLEADRRCFAFFHPVMPDTPLIFVEVALTRGMSGNIAELLNQPPPHHGTESYNTAIFYSINNCLSGLRGVSFGNFLIKQVIEQVAADMPEVKVYATLSPIPGFLAWLKENVERLSFVDAPLRAQLQALAENPQRRLLEDSPALAEILPRVCAWYLLRAQSRGQPSDAVARFHLGNGARLERINSLADLSDNGLAQSAGLMVNYLYDRATLTRNHEAYEQSGELVCSAEVSKLLP